ncbi:MAG: hypothetical protein JWN73_3678 [Betaproteobacteria bacterium]|nr:hypothetical protein [Betaproteobacteria bacterium]
MDNCLSASAPARLFALQALLGQLGSLARARALSDGHWAAAAKLPQATLSRLKKRSDCNLETLVALAAPLQLRVALAEALPREMPAAFGRKEEEKLLALCAAPALDLRAWRAAGPRFFMAGVAMLLACASGMDRPTLLMLAEALYPGMSTPEVFDAWLKSGPVRPARFLPMLRERLDKYPLCSPPMTEPAHAASTSHLGKTYLDALRFLIGRIEEAVRPYAKRLPEPVRMYVAGGTCLAFYVNRRVSDDIDATFSRKIVLPEDLEATYMGADGKPRLLYFDYQYNDTLGLMHQDAHEDSTRFPLPGIDPKLVEIRLLAPLDLAVSKLSRYSEIDQGDIVALAEAGLFTEAQLRARAEDALIDYIGNVDTLKTTIELACGLVRAARRKAARAKKP